MIFHKEIYAMASVAGGLAYWLTIHLDSSVELSAIISFTVTCVIRFLAVKYHLSLPKLKKLVAEEE